ncbi:TPR-like protein [Mytilinidion resinicola]|uniref:TPR-like protein n=1 Tax=Mytilinidion resinicola TaxID=574789 RepID=A0A6A6YYM2_9PEZI|nr:TPR-like protein [Mytilinidion resinicola]KAF2813025.1 TPR-like protein [Mytilinidion resinicola]
MPLIYGEGQKKAFIRLRKEIEESLKDQRPAKPLPSSTVPFRRDDDFISRDSLDKVRQICAKPAARAALVGLGGVGKSQIAIEYAYQVRDKLQDGSPTTWVFWVHAGTQARFEEGYRRIAETTRMDGLDNPKVDVLRLVHNWLCDESNGRWVMIVDNADDSAVFFPPHHGTQSAGVSSPGQAAVSDFLPQSLNGSILITSRSRDLAYGLTGNHASIVEVNPMDESDALTLLQKKLSCNVNKDDAVELLHSLDYMPLAITQAAAYIKQRAPRITISRYRDEVRRSDHDRARLLSKGIQDNRRDGRASNSIIATWQISFEHIRREMPTAARLLSLMSLFDRQGIPELLLQGRYQRDEDRKADFEEDIHTLMNYSLIGISVDGREFKMHRLVQFSTKKWLELYNELEEWKEVYVTLMDDNYPVGRHENWTVCQALFLHARAVVACRPAGGRAVKAWASVLFKAGWYASEMGKYKEAEEMSGNALEAREAALGAEHPSTLTSLSNLALVLQGQGKYEQAEDMNQRALEGKEKALGKEHPDTLTSVSNLALVLRYQGKYEQAEDMNRRALEGREKVLGKEHPDTLTSVSNLASVLQFQGKYEQAEDMNRRALEGREKALGKEHPDTLTSVSNLASVLRSQGKEKALGKEHPDTLTSVNNLALVLQDQGKYEQAEDMNRRVLEGREKVLGKEHPDTLASVYCLAYLLHQQQQYEDASPLYQRACAGYQEKLGLDHPTTQACMKHYSSLQQLWTLQGLESMGNVPIDVRGDGTHSLSTSQDTAQSIALEPTKISKRHRIFQKLGWR